MIHFEVRDEVQDVVEVVKEFATNEIAPHFREWEEKEGLPQEFCQKFGELGLSALEAPTSLGGAQFSLEDTFYVLEAFARYGDIGVAYSLPGPGFLADFLLTLGNEEQQKGFFQIFLDNPLKRGTVMIREDSPDFTWDGIQCIARKSEKVFILNGKKTFVPLGKESDFFLIIAKEEESGELAAFIVDKDREGLSFSDSHHLLGLNTMKVYDCEIQNLEVPFENKLEKQGLENIQKAYMRMKIKNSAFIVGAMQASCDTAFRYANERVTFGKTLWQHQGMAFFMAEMAATLNQTRNQLIQLATNFENLKPSEIAEGLLNLEHCAVEIGTHGVQVLGGAGYVRDYPVEKWMRDLRTATLLFELDPYYEAQILTD
ncbi:MAG: acyl-CoA dehydrogenase [Planctomycetota bacterium]|nr:MAG: acyl-CoA dehydrogenase [Planctomycetota bacterium]